MADDGDILPPSLDPTQTPVYKQSFAELVQTFANLVTAYGTLLNSPALAAYVASGGTATSAGSVPGTATVGSSGMTFDQLLAAIDALQGATTAASQAFNGEDADLVASAIVQGAQDSLKTKMAFLGLGPDGLPAGPLLKQVQQTSKSSAELLTFIGGKSDDGLTFILNDEVTTFADGKSLADFRTSIQSSFDTANATILADYKTLSDADTAEAQARLALASTLGTLSSTVQTNYTTLTTAISTEATARLSLASDYNGFKSTASSQLTTLSTASTSAASSIQTLQSNYGTLSATVTQQAGTIATLQGRAAVYWKVSLDAGSGKAFLSAYADNAGSSAIVLDAGQIWFGPYAFYSTVTRTFEFRYNGRAEVFGTAFGSSNQFMEWSGADIPLSQMTTANALSYKTTSGQAGFFGITLGGTTQTQGAFSQNAVPGNNSIIATTGTLVKVGGSVKVDISVNIYMQSIQSGSRNTAYTNNGSTSCSVTIQPVRATSGSGPWTNVGGQVTIPGSIVYEYDAEETQNSWTGGITASFSVADTPGDGSYFYGAKIIGFNSGGTPATPQPFSVNTFATNNRG